MANFVSYSDMQTLMGKIGNKFAALTGAYIAKGSCAFASLPATPTTAQVGFVYNVTDDFTTDSRFVEGTGKDYPAGSNVVVVDSSTYAAVASPSGDPSAQSYYELDSTTGRYVLSKDTSVDPLKTYYTKTTLIQLDVLAGFVDLSDIEDAIDDLAADFAPAFDATSGTYAVGDFVTYENKLYKFKAAHSTAGAFNPAEVDAVTVADLVTALSTSISTTKSGLQNNIADQFDATSGVYAIGDIVYHEDGLYKFKAAHAAGDPWSASEVDAVQVEDLIEDAEPESLTPQQISDLEDLLD